MASFSITYPAPGGTIAPTLTAYGTFSISGFWADLLENTDPGVTAEFEKKLAGNKGLSEKWSALKEAGDVVPIPDDFRELVGYLPLICVLKCNNVLVETVNGVLYCSGTLWKATFAARKPSPTDVYRFEAVLTGGTNPQFSDYLTVSDTGLLGTAVECGSNSGLNASNSEGIFAALPHSSGSTVIGSSYPRNPRVKSCQCVIFKIVGSLPVIWGVVPGEAAFGQFEVLVPIPHDASTIGYLGDVLLLNENGIALYPAYRVSIR